MPFQIIRGDIAALPFRVDAIVNTANPHGRVGRGTDRAIHEAAGAELLRARQTIGDIPRGGAAITPAFCLNAEYVIHAVGIGWHGGEQSEEQTLRSAYLSALSLAVQHRCTSVAFPLLSSGNYGFPQGLALEIALGAFGDFLETQELQIYLVVFGREAFEISQQLSECVESYIDEHYIEQRLAHEYEDGFALRGDDIAPAPTELPLASKLCVPNTAPVKPKKSIEDRLRERSETFTETLRRIMTERELSNPTVYRRANMDKKTFNKIYNDAAHQPSRRSALQLAVALEMNLDETQDFIARAGYALSPSSRFDVVLSCLIENGIHNMLEIDAVLFEFTETTLSSC